MKVILLGSPGVGKGTYAQDLTKIYKIPSISAGELLRQHVEDQEFGGIIKEHQKKGILVPVEIVIKLLKKRIKQKDCKKGFMLDGYPRSMEQAKALEKITKIDKVLYFVAPDKVIITRLSNRRTCKKCGSIFNIRSAQPKRKGICDECGSKLSQRDDDKPKTIKERLRVYREETSPLIKYYRKKRILYKIDASESSYSGRDKIIGACRKALEA